MRRSIKFSIAGGVAVAMAGGAVAYAAVANAGNAVTVQVEGATHKITTTAATVNGALEDAKLTVGAHDAVTPPGDAKIHDGTQIVVRRGRLLHLVVDGAKHDAWVTVPTVAQALAKLGYSTADFSSVPREARLALTPTSIVLRTPKQLTIVHDGKTQHVTSTDANVQAALAHLGIKVGKQDRLSPIATAALANGQKIVLQRVTHKNVVVTEPVDYPTTQQEDSSMYEGDSNVAVTGHEGSAAVTYAEVLVDGKLISKKKVSSKQLTAPVTKVVKVGTKARPAAPPAPPPASPPTGGGGGLNWDAVAQCESGGNWHLNDGSGFYGGLQFLASTWISNGGGQYASRADLATREQQIAIATSLYNSRGSAPWPVCGKYL